MMTAELGGLQVTGTDLIDTKQGMINSWNKSKLMPVDDLGLFCRHSHIDCLARAVEKAADCMLEDLLCTVYRFSFVHYYN